MATTNPYRLLAEYVQSARRARGWTLRQFTEESCTKCKRIIDIEKGRIEAQVTNSSKRLREGIACSIMRILHVLDEKDVKGWLTKLQLPHDETLLRNALEKLHEKKEILSDQFLDEVITEEDVEFLQRMQKEFTEKMTIGFALDLLRRRKQPTSK